MERRSRPPKAGRVDQPERKVSPGIQRAMRGLSGFANQAVGAYAKLKDIIGNLVPVVARLGQTWAKMKAVLGATTAAANQAATSFGRLKTSLYGMVPVLATLIVQFGSLSKAMTMAGTAATSAMAGISAGSLKAAASAGVFGAGLTAILAPVAAIAAGLGLAYVAIARWQEVPGWLKAILLVASPLVFAIRAIATAWNVATAPVRIFRATVDAAMSAVLAPIRLAEAAVRGLASGAVAAVKSIGSAFASLPVRFVLPSIGLIRRAFSGLTINIQGWAASIAGSLNRLVEPARQAAQEFAAAGVESQKLADAAGLSVEQMTALGYAAERVGSSSSALSSGIAAMNAALDDARRGGEDSAATFAQLGLSVDRLAQMNPEERFTALAEAVAGLADPLDRAAVAQRVFGSAGESLLPMLAQGRAGLQNMKDEAQRLGLVMTGPQAKAAKALTDAYASLKNSLSGLWRSIGAAIAPQLTATAQATTKIVAAVTSWVQRNQPLIAQLFKIASTVASVAGGIVTLGTLLAAATPELLALTAAAGAGWLAWTRYGESIKTALGGAMRIVTSFVDETRRVLGGVWDAIEGGQLELAVEIAMAGAQEAWIKGLRLISSVTGETLGGVFNALASGDWQSALTQAWAAIQQIYLQGAGALDEVFVGLSNTIDQAITYLRQQLNVALSYIAKFAIDTLKTTSDVIGMLAKVDPTGKMADTQKAIAASLKGSTLVKLSKDPSAANAGLADDAAQRGFGRLTDLQARNTDRAVRANDLDQQARDARNAANANAAGAANAVDAKLAALLDKAAAARAAAQQRPAADIARNGQLAGLAQAAGQGGGLGATFSAAALLSMGGRGNAQERAAKAAEAMAGKLDALIVLEEKRQREARAMQAQWTA